MFSDIHHGYKTHRHFTHHLRLILTLLIAVVALIGLTSTSPQLAAQVTSVSTQQVSQTLDVAGFGSARMLLIASLASPVPASRHPVAECSPFGALAACAADHFAALGHVILQSPA